MSKPSVVLALSLLCTAALGQPKLNDIHFAPGASAATVSGNVTHGALTYYTLRARKGQRLGIAIASPDRNAAFEVYCPGYALSRDELSFIMTCTSLRGVENTDDQPAWEGELPSTGKYLIVVRATRGHAAYRLDVGVH